MKINLYISNSYGKIFSKEKKLLKTQSVDCVKNKGNLAKKRRKNIYRNHEKTKIEKIDRINLYFLLYNLYETFDKR